eukprot:737436-Pyramimonas_sp.AAC.1
MPAACPGLCGGLRGVADLASVGIDAAMGPSHGAQGTGLGPSLHLAAGPLPCQAGVPGRSRLHLQCEGLPLGEYPRVADALAVAYDPVVVQ